LLVHDLAEPAFLVRGALFEGFDDLPEVRFVGRFQAGFREGLDPRIAGPFRKPFNAIE
jgi:hypothetical protein